MSKPTKQNLTHINEKGDCRMVDVGNKPYSDRVAIAQATVSMKKNTMQAIENNLIGKGDVLTCARVAGIMASKKTSELIPMCHPVPISSVEIDISKKDEQTLLIQAKCCNYYQTGIEMEALTAVSVSALTIYDMCKSIDKGMIISNTQLIHKSGGKSGKWDNKMLENNP